MRWRVIAAFDPTVYVVRRRIEDMAMRRIRLGMFADLIAAPDELELTNRRIESRYRDELVRCSRCKEYKTKDKYGKDKANGGLLQRYCKACRAEWIAARRLSKWKRNSSDRQM